jgi:hypothetical protein
MFDSSRSEGATDGKRLTQALIGVCCTAIAVGQQTLSGMNRGTAQNLLVDRCANSAHNKKQTLYSSKINVS